MEESGTPNTDQKPRYKIIFKRDICIGALPCAAAAPDFWIRADDGKVDLKVSLDEIDGDLAKITLEKLEGATMMEEEEEQEEVTPPSTPPTVSKDGGTSGTVAIVIIVIIVIAVAVFLLVKKGGKGKGKKGHVKFSRSELRAVK